MLSDLDTTTYFSSVAFKIWQAAKGLDRSKQFTLSYPVSVVAIQHLVTSQKCPVLFTPDVTDCNLLWENTKLR